MSTRILTPEQREARRLYMVAYNARHRARHLRWNRQHYLKNRAKMKAQSRAWYYANKERVKIAAKLRILRGGEELRRHKRKLWREWYYRNHERNKRKIIAAALRRPLEKRRISGRRWVAKNRERYREMVRRAARKASILLTDAHVRRLLARRGIRATPAQIIRERQAVQNRRASQLLKLTATAARLCKL